MSLTQAAGLPVTIERDGKTYIFPKLKRGQIANLIDGWVTEDRIAITSILTDSGADAAIKVEKLTDLFERSRSLGFLYRQLFDRRRVDQILSVSIERVEQHLRLYDVDSIPFDDDERQDIAASVCGINWKDYLKRLHESVQEGGESKKDVGQ